MGDLVQWEHRQNYGGIGVGPWAQKPAMSPKWCKIGPRLLWRTNRKSHTHYWLAPKSIAFDDLEWPKCTLAEKNCFTEPTNKNLNKDRPKQLAAKCRWMILVCRNIRFVWIFARVLYIGGAEWQWGSRNLRLVYLSFEISDSKAHIIIQ